MFIFSLMDHEDISDLNLCLRILFVRFSLILEAAGSFMMYLNILFCILDFCVSWFLRTNINTMVCLGFPPLVQRKSLIYMRNLTELCPISLVSTSVQIYKQVYTIS